MIPARIRAGGVDPAGAEGRSTTPDPAPPSVAEQPEDRRRPGSRPAASEEKEELHVRTPCPRGPAPRRPPAPMSEPLVAAQRVAAAAERAWHGSGAGSDEGVCVGVIAALALLTRADPEGPDPAERILAFEDEEVAELLGEVWALFGISRPELALRCGPFAEWLDAERPDRHLLAGAAAVARAAIRSGLLELTLDLRAARQVDLIGCVEERVCGRGAEAARGEFRGRPDVAELIARVRAGGLAPGQSSCDPAAGTGGLCGGSPQPCAPRAAPRPTRPGADATSRRSRWRGSRSTSTSGASVGGWWSAWPTASPSPTGSGAPGASSARPRGGCTRGWRGRGSPHSARSSTGSPAPEYAATPDRAVPRHPPPRRAPRTNGGRWIRHTGEDHRHRRRPLAVGGGSRSASAPTRS